MRRSLNILSLISVLLVLALARPSHAQNASTPASPIDVICSLRQGGYVIYLHHGDVDDTPERNLTDEGRTEARLVGEGFAELGIPAGQVLSSPFDRTIETAQLAFGGSETVADLAGFPPPSPDSDAPRRIAALSAMLATPPPGTNTVLVSHYEMLLGAAGIATGPAESVVFRPTLNGDFTLVTRITWDGWASLIAQSAASKAKC
jgi:broad specificity phosphatase PhoE